MENVSVSELAALYRKRREIELTYDESKNYLKLPGAALQSKKSELIIQELFGYLLAHYTIRSLIHQAARKNKVDPDRLSFINAVRILCRKITAAHFPPQSYRKKNFYIFFAQIFLYEFRNICPCVRSPSA